MGKMKRNRSVPQAYLRAFAADPERKEKIWRFSKEDGDPELKPIEKVAYRHYLYAPKDASGQRDYSFEVQLSRLEQWFGERPWELLLTEYLDLGDPTMRKMVSLLTAVMYLRNSKGLELSNEIRTDRWWSSSRNFRSCPSNGLSIKARLTKSIRAVGSVFREGDDEELKKSWIASVKQASWLAEWLIKKRWSIVFSDPPGFITSDHPVTVLHPSLSFWGSRQPGDVRSIPLEPLSAPCYGSSNEGTCKSVLPGRRRPAKLELLDMA